jgi:tRNA 2-thiouridine synthesizing protein E
MRTPQTTEENKTVNPRSTRTLDHNGKSYTLDDQGFLIDPLEWDTEFVEGLSKRKKLVDNLTSKHWMVINYIRLTFSTTGHCPLVYQACRDNNLRLKDLKKLFPTGYLRGACRLAGVTYKEAVIKGYWQGEDRDEPPLKEYRIDVHGFLIDSDEWDEEYAGFRAAEMWCYDKLADGHWLLIRFVRNFYKKNGRVPTVYETCESNQLELRELEQLFPDGYHRGLIRIAGLRVR